MRRADEEAAAAGIPGTLLMEAAGRAVADAALRNFPQVRDVLVLCGKGNNGGDGYVAARYLRIRGLRIRVLELTSEPGGDAAVARSALLAHLAPAPLRGESLRAALDGPGLIIDALFGSGLTRPLSGELAEIVETVNGSRLPVLAVDVPSGLNADSAVPIGPHIAATRTVQLAGPKIASAFEPARSAFGDQEVVDIGIPASILDASAEVRLLGDDDVAAIPTRHRDAHKYEVGTVLVLAGSPRYLGAAELACRGAYRAGAGLVTLAAEGRLPVSWPEIVFHRIDWGSGALDELAAISERRAQTVVAGPGLDEAALEYLPQLIARRSVPWVLDAGALRPSPELEDAVRRHARCILTPHHGEAAKLLGVDAPEVKADPLAAATGIAERWNAICVLKGASTVIAGRDSLAVATEGHEGMATGGTGDVLAGVVGAFLAAAAEDESEALERVEAAVRVHGRAGYRAGARLGIAMIASDLLAELPAAIRELAPGPSRIA